MISKSVEVLFVSYSIWHTQLVHTWRGRGCSIFIEIYVKRQSTPPAPPSTVHSKYFVQPNYFKIWFRKVWKYYLYHTVYDTHNWCTLGGAGGVPSLYKLMLKDSLIPRGPSKWAAFYGAQHIFCPAKLFQYMISKSVHHICTTAGVIR